LPLQKRSKDRLPIDEVQVFAGVSDNSLKFTAEELTYLGNIRKDMTFLMIASIMLSFKVLLYWWGMS